MKAYVCLDESGKLHPNDPCRYFIVGGFISDDYLSVAKEYRRVIGDLKKKYGVPVNKELKASSINIRDQRKAIDKMMSKCNIEPCAIVVDKNNFTSDKTKENEFYNYFIKSLLHYMHDNKKVKLIRSAAEIDLRLDNRTIKTRYANSLHGYLRTEFVTNYGTDIHFDSSFIESHLNYEIQFADLICNYVFRGFNALGFKKRNFTDKHISYMPYKTFGL